MGSGSARSEAGGTPPLRYEAGDVILTLRVQPGAVRSEWAGWYGSHALRLRLAAPAVEGKANRACRRFLADAFSVPAGRVEILRGEAARTKQVIVRQVDPIQWELFRARWAIS